MRRYFATYLAYCLTLAVVLPILLAYGVSGVGFFLVSLCMAAIFMAGRHAGYVDNHFERLEREDVDA